MSAGTRRSPQALPDTQVEQPWALPAEAVAEKLATDVILAIVVLNAVWPASGWAATAGWWLAGLGLGGFVPLGAVALAASQPRTAGTA